MHYKVEGHSEWIEALATRYKNITIDFGNRGDSLYINAIIHCGGRQNKNIIVGVYNKENNVGKIFDRREVVRE